MNSSGLFGILCIISVLHSGYCAKFPKDVKKCKHGDLDCLKETINDIFRTKYLGVSGLNLVTIDPIAINSIDIDQGAESPVNIKLKFRNSSFTGVPTITVSKVTGFGKNLTGPHTLYLTGGHVSLGGQYEIQGRVLILPISGAGDSNITLANLNLKMTFHGKPLVKNGKTYMTIDDLRLGGKVGRMYVNLDNLFNGDKALGDNMNAFLNENWEDIFNELKGKIFEAFSLIFQSVINNVFAKFPYDDLFVDA